MSKEEVYVVLTCRAYEGSWIEEIFKTEDGAKAFLEKNKNNTELRVEKWKVN